MTISLAQTASGGPVTRLARAAVGMVLAIADYPLGFSRVQGPLRALAPPPGEPGRDTPRCTTAVMPVHGYLGNRTS